MKLRVSWPVEVWHPDSPGVRLVVWRRFARFRRGEFATLGEAIRGMPPTESLIDGRNFPHRPRRG